MAALSQDEIRRLIARGKRRDAIFRSLGVFCLGLGLLVILLLVGNMVLTGAARLSPDFFLNFASRRASQAGILSAWVGSLLVMLVTAVAAVPLGVAAGLYLEEYARRNWLTEIIEINITNLAAVPSIVYGLLALGIFVYSSVSARASCPPPDPGPAHPTHHHRVHPGSHPGHPGRHPGGVGSGGGDPLADLPPPHHSLRLPGVLTGVIIGLARAIGETAPIITIGALTFIAFLPPAPFLGEPAAGLSDWLLAPFTVMPIQIFNWTSRPDPAFEVNAAAAGFVLVAMVLAMNGLAIWLRYRLRRNIHW